MKTKKAWLTFAKERMIVCTTEEGDKDPFGKSIWYDSDGCAYELSYARFARVWAFIPCPSYDKVVAK